MWQSGHCPPEVPGPWCVCNHSTPYSYSPGQPWCRTSFQTLNIKFFIFHSPTSNRDLEKGEQTRKPLGRSGTLYYVNHSLSYLPIFHRGFIEECQHTSGLLSFPFPGLACYPVVRSPVINCLWRILYLFIIIDHNPIRFSAANSV